MKHYCTKCKKPVKNFYAKLCLNCYRISQKDPKNNPMFGIKRPDVVIRNRDKYKGGLPHCVDCGKELAHYRSKRCKTCANSGKLNPRFGKKEDTIKKNIRIKNLLKLIHCSSNKLETNINELLNNLFPNKYKFVGDGTTVLDGFNPDFINIEEKKIIEVYGDYWHNLPGYKERDVRRIVAYTKYGYKTLIIWEHELKNINSLINKLIIFS